MSLSHEYNQKVKDMPLYEFICEDCGETFEELILSANSTNQVTCPHCKSDLVRKLISKIAAKVSSGGSIVNSYSSGSSCGTRST
jgi:putative FmdB family regulatory protein